LWRNDRYPRENHWFAEGNDQGQNDLCLRFVTV